MNRVLCYSGSVTHQASAALYTGLQAWSWGKLWVQAASPGVSASCSGMRKKALGNRRKAVLFLREAPCGPGGKGLSVKSPAAGTCNPILPSSSFLNLSLKTGKPEGLQTLGLVLLVSVLCLESQVFPPEPRVFGGGSYFCACLSSPALLVLWVFTGFSRRAHPGLR